MVGVVLDTIVVPAPKITFQDQEPRSHIIVAMWNDQRPLRIAKICPPNGSFAGKPPT